MSMRDVLSAPPMGWNSYDYFDTTVSEKDIREQAKFMAENLKEFGWEYIVVDIEWYSYDAGTQRDEYQYIPFWRVEMDEYSRLLPCPERFPSSIGGKGFGPLAEYIHSLGLKFGIHIMRGIPRIAAHSHTKILGVEVTANQIAGASNICSWNPDMYGIEPSKKGAQEYYDSIMKLYAGWGVDFIKCDDICRMDTPTCKPEIAMLSKAIDNANRKMVLSLSPGPAIPTEAWYYGEHANMWRITDDFWDTWPLLKDMFKRCETWQSHVGNGSWPDCDMLPLGKIGKAFGSLRDTGFTKEEQRTMMNLWSIFRSPLMLGANMLEMDDWTMSLLTNKDLLRTVRYGTRPIQIARDEEQAIWWNEDSENGQVYLALFNLTDETKNITMLDERCKELDFVREAWGRNQDVRVEGDVISAVVSKHDSMFLVLKQRYKIL